MKARFLGCLGLVAGLALTISAQADDVKSGLEKKVGGAFDVKAITGDAKGKTLCYV